MTTAFVGHAGTGKTYSLVRFAEEFVRERQPKFGQGVLGLTFMHGARRRMAEALAPIAANGWHVECQTIDCFCLDLIRRFRRHLGVVGLPVPIEDNRRAAAGLVDTAPATFDEIRNLAAEALGEPAVRTCVAASYPLVVVDEFQDCQGSLLRVVDALATTTELAVAADPFQQLDSSEGQSEAEAWLHDHAAVQQLDRQHRSENARLLNTASAIRAGIPCANGIDVRAVDGPGLAAWEIARRIAGDGWRGRVALLAPAGPWRSPFVRRVLASLEKPLGKKWIIGPFPFAWEQSSDARIKQALEELDDLFGAAESVGNEELRRRQSDPSISCRRGLAMAARLLALRGGTTIPRALLQEVVRTAMIVDMAYRQPSRGRFRVGLTVHGAKNREFDYVFVLWPHEAQGKGELPRRLLYNGITRARKNAVVLVQGGDKRLDRDALLSSICGRALTRGCS